MTETVQIVFSAEAEIGQFNDALHIPADEYAAMTADQIAALKQTRVDAWVAAVKLASANTETIE